MTKAFLTLVLRVLVAGHGGLIMSWGVSLTSVSTTMVGPFEFLTVFSSEMVPRLVAFLHLRDSFDWLFYDG